VGERGTILISTNATNWQGVSQGLNDDWSAIAYGAGRFVVPGYQDAVVLTSTDGVEWDSFPLTHAGYFRGAAWGNNRFAAVGNGGAIATSPDGTHWTYQSSGADQDLAAIAFGRGLFVAVGQAGTLLTSADGSVWNAGLVTNVNLGGVTFGADRFVATGDGGTVLVSSNGVNWDCHPAAAGESLRQVTYGSLRFMALTAAGTMITSADGISWTTVSNVVSAGSLAFGNSYFLAGSSPLGLWTSSDGMSWQSRSALKGKSINNFAFGGGTFVAVGNGGVILQSDPIPAPVTVTVQSDVLPPLGTCGFSVDGFFYDTAQTFQWAGGSSHVIAADMVQFGDPGVGFVWGGWSDAGPALHTVTPTTDTNYTVKYVPLYHLAMSRTAGGTITPADSWPQPGEQVTITATPKPGCTFLGWVGVGTNAYSGSAASARITMSQPVSETALFDDPVRPTLSITKPKSGQTWKPLAFTVTGKASDNDTVTNVLVQINGGAWEPATTTDGWRNWTGQGTLAEGDNTVLAYAVDAAGNCSQTNHLDVPYVFIPEISLKIIGKGIVKGVTDGQQIRMGRKVTAHGKPVDGYALTNWLVQVNGSTVLSTNRATPFIMQSNLTLTVTFADVARPKLTITAPKSGQRVTNAVFNMTGTVTDNGPGSRVYYRVNSGAWTNASGWSLWSARVTLQPGNNTLWAYAVDAWGNGSSTNHQTVTYDAPDASAVVQTNSANVTISNGRVNLGFNVPAGQTFVIEASTNLMNWVPIETNSVSDAPLRVNDAAAAGQDQRYYRLRFAP
jgi:hypothetical protein